MKLFAAIEKVEELEDGHLLVSGVASSEAVDSDGEIITSEAMKAAIPDYMTCANVREMHQPKAAGVAVSCEVGEDGRTYLTAKVVDSEAKEKVRQSVYKGFSIGGKVMKRTKNIIEALKLVEISLVDRPANPEALFSLAKMEEAIMDAPGTDPVTDPTATTDPEPTQAAPVIGKAEVLEAIQKAWAGEEIWDTRLALEALEYVFGLFIKEQTEGEDAQAAELRTACDALRRFIASEIMEDNTGKAAGAEDLKKKGARFSKATKEALKAAQVAMESGAACLKALGYEDAEEEEDEEGADKGAVAQDLQKAAGLQDALTKAETARDEALAKADTLQKELDALKAEKPLKAVPIEKAQDGAPITKSKGPEAEAVPTDPLDAMKAVHASGGRVVSPFNRLG